MAFKPRAVGPLKTRRFGKTINIINCPESYCTYSCVYCHGGHTQTLQYERMEFFNPLEIMKAVRLAIVKSKEPRESYNYITYIPDGEPTQDINIGKEIDLIEEFGIKTAVMTNSSLVWREDVQADLMKADCVSLKLDALEPKLWQETHRPHKNSRFATIIDGVLTFAEMYKGRLLTETMLVQNHNDSEEHAGKIGAFLKKIKPAMAYISIPTNPPTESWVKPPDEQAVNKFFQIVHAKYTKVEYMIGYEVPEQATFGNAKLSILAEASRHPLSKNRATEILNHSNAEWGVMKKLLDNEELVEVSYEGFKFYVRKIKTNKATG